MLNHAALIKQRPSGKSYSGEFVFVKDNGTIVSDVTLKDGSILKLESFTDGAFLHLIGSPFSGFVVTANLEINGQRKTVSFYPVISLASEGTIWDDRINVGLQKPEGTLTGHYIGFKDNEDMGSFIPKIPVSIGEKTNAPEDTFNIFWYAGSVRLYPYYLFSPSGLFDLPAPTEGEHWPFELTVTEIYTQDGV